MVEKIENAEETKKKTKKIRVWVVIIFLILFAIFSFINYRSEYLQIKEIGEEYISVFKKNITYKYTVTAINFVILFIVIFITNLFIKKGLKEFFIAEKKTIPKLPNKSIALILGAALALISSDFLINKMMLFSNMTWFGGNGDPIFGQDIGYYMFQKPFIETMLVYIIGVLAALIVYSIIYYIAVFNIFFDGIDGKMLKKSVLVKQVMIYALIIAIGISLMTLLKTQDILFEEFIKIDDAERTALIGAGFTDVTIKLWGDRILSIIIFIATIFTAYFIKNEKYKKAVISILSIPGYLVILFIASAGFQIAFVNPNILDNEKAYIEYNIENTKRAYNIDINEIEINSTGTITSDEVEKYNKTISNIPIISENMTLSTLNNYQDNVGFYKYENTKIQNYNINGEEKTVYVTPREIETDGTNRTYDNKTYNYTHGYGAVISSATETDETGAIKYVQVDFTDDIRNINVTEPRIYFGLKTNYTIVVNKNNKTEYDYPITSSTNAENDYEGKSGISLNFFDRLILGLNTNNLNLAFTDDTGKIIMNRNIIQRAKKIMPYLVYDEKPYLVINDEGKQIWVLDAYTVSDKYPYSQKTTIKVEDANQKINYIRNSVKVLIDAYDGTIKFYITDRTDPIAMAYANIYDGLFAKEDEKIPSDIEKHITYPELLYEVQSEMYQRYHKIQTEVLYRNDDLWQIAKFNANKASNSAGNKMDAYFTMTKTAEGEEKLGLVIPYTGYGKQNIISYLVGTYDGSPKLTLYKFDNKNNILGPALLNQQIEQDETISKELASLNVSGSKIIRNMIIVPIDNTLLYVEPVYQVLLNEKVQVQSLRNVIVASGNKIAIGNDMESALNNLLSKSAVNIEVERTDNEEDLINAIIKANSNLQESNNNSDWEMIGKDIKRLQELINLLKDLRKEKEKENTENTITVNETINNVTSSFINNVIE